MKLVVALLVVLVCWRCARGTIDFVIVSIAATTTVTVVSISADCGGIGNGNKSSIITSHQQHQQCQKKQNHDQ